MGCIVNCFGFGAGHDAKLMGAIAEAGSGMYFYIESADTIASSFADCLGGLLSVVAQNIVITLRPSANITIGTVQTTFPVTKSNEITTITLRDLQSEEHRDIVVEVNLPKCAIDASAHSTEDADYSMLLLKAQVSYSNTISGAKAETTATLSVHRPPSDSPLLRDVQTDKELLKQRNRIAAAAAMERANEEAARGNFEAARSSVQAAANQIQSSAVKNDEKQQMLLANLDESLQGMTTATEWQNVGSKKMKAFAGAHYQQRSNMQTEAAYDTGARFMMKSAAKRK